MKRLLTSTTALSLAFAPMSSLPLAAQVAVDTPEGTAFCLAAEAELCPEGEVCFLAEGGDCAALDIEVEAASALLEAVEDGTANPETDPAAETVAPDPAAEGAEDEAVAPAEDQPGAETEAEETADDPAPAPSPEPVEEEEALVTPQDPPATASDEDVADAPSEEPVAEEDGQGEAETAVQPDAGGQSEAPESVTQTPEPVEAVEEGATGAAPEGAAPETATVEPEDAPELPAAIIGEAAAVLQNILGAAEDDDDGETPAAAAVEGQAGSDEPTAAAEVTETEITDENTRASSEEFAPALSTSAAAESRRGLSDLERFGLVALGALAVGAILRNGDQVVSNSGDRVVVEDERGEFRVLKDDDTLLRRPGSRLRTETFNDGSTRSTLLREDGSSIVTIRDASGRVLRRARYAPDGTEMVLIDDLQPFDRIDVAALPPPPAPRDQTVISAAQSPDDLARALAAIEGRENARAYSLRQIREYREVRALAPMIDVESITFRTGSAAIDVSEAEKLSTLGRLIAGVLVERPYEIFLVEGHTDAVGSASSNLALSDRRAESVALALTEYFGIPPENLVVQGYGEAELRIPTQAAEERNRRAAVRLISPLLRTAANR